MVVMDRRESVRHTWQGNGECACRKGEGCSPEDRQEGEGEEGREREWERKERKRKTEGT